MEAVREKPQAVQQQPTKNVQQEAPKKKGGFMNRFRTTKEERKQAKAEKQEARHAQEEAASKIVTRDGAPIVSTFNGSKFRPSDVRPTGAPTLRNGKKILKKSVVLEQQPAARDAAFSGPPRYDWVDIETAAAIKVQSVVRRNKVMDAMEAEGTQTKAMRNRSRRLRARSRKAASEDTPGMFQCCGAGLIFGDSTEDDEKAQRAYQKAMYEEKKRDRENEEARKRAYKPMAKNTYNVQEAVEVVE